MYPVNSVPHPFIRRLLRVLGRQHWLRFGIRDRIIRQFHPPDGSVDLAFICRFDRDRLYAGNFQSFIDWSVYYFGSFCMEELDLLADLVSGLSSPVFLDIGANSGNHTLYMAARTSWVYSFDPFPEALTQLRTQLSINTFKNITVLPFGMGSRDELLPFRLPAGNNRGVGAFLAHGLHTSGLPIYPTMLPVRHADRLLAELDVKTVSIVKIDTEGFEEEVLRGLSETLLRDRPAVFFEWSQPARNHRASPNPISLFPAGYSFYQVLPPDCRFGLLTKGRYRLEPLSGADVWPVANVLAISN